MKTSCTICPLLPLILLRLSPSFDTENIICKKRELACAIIPSLVQMFPLRLGQYNKAGDAFVLP